MPSSLSSAALYAKNKAYHRAYQKELWASREPVTDEEREKRRAKQQRWREKNRDKMRAYGAVSRESRKQRVPSWFGDFDKFVLQEASHLAVLREKLTGVRWQVDHVIPLCARQVSGLHVWNNLQVITATENHRKRNQYTVS